jgi:transcriptional regulator with XRE-family HTH domain
VNNSDRSQRPQDNPPLHRLGEVRKLRRLSIGDVARKLQLDPDQVKQQEQATTDLTLSLLYRWQQLLKVPIGDLVIDAHHPLASPAVSREKLAKVMEVGLWILAHTKQPAIRRMAHTLVDQLVELAPELKPIAVAHSAGQEQRFDEQGRAMKGPLPVDFFLEPID